MRGGDFMMRKMLFGIAAGLVLVSAGVRADDNDTAGVEGAAASTTRSSHTIGFGCLGGWFSNQPPRQSCGDAGARSAVREWPSASRSLPPRRGWEQKYGKRQSCFPKLVAPAA